ncbi:MAG TPA: hypothetical protein VFM93_11425 [Candidatus Limnocylindria bacterium]|nr:hypothetical protein [Candidatus Limnocylindria bacterium]
MRLALTGASAAATLVAALTVLLRDPGDAYALPTFVAAIAVAAGAAAARLLLPARRGRRGASAPATRAIRRGLAVGAAVGLLAALRVVDGLTPLTAAFVIAGFALAEVALTARAS